MKLISDAIKSRRKNRKLTQQELATASGVALSVVKRIEAANPRVTVRNLEKILNLFGLKLDLIDAKQENTRGIN